MFSLRLTLWRILILHCSTMILQLLLHAVILSVAALQTINITEGINSTFSVLTDYNTTNPNVTSSLDLDAITEIEKELYGNHTLTMIPEDDERFMDQTTPYTHCDTTILTKYMDIICGQTFHTEMEAIGADNWCDHTYFIRPYNNLTICLEELTDIAGCYYPNPDIHDYFLNLHSIYFQSCITEEDEYFSEDVLSNVVTVLTVIPVCIIPVLAGLVAWKNSAQH